MIGVCVDPAKYQRKDLDEGTAERFLMEIEGGRDSDGDPITTSVTYIMRNNFTIYQSNYGKNEEPLSFSSVGDTASVAVLLQGAPENMPPVVTLDMVLGENYTIPGFGDSITVNLSELYRDFKRGDSYSVQSNPAVKIDVKVNGEQRWSIFAFKNFPGLNMPMHEDILFSFSMH